jgi:hypothetical protein
VWTRYARVYRSAVVEDPITHKGRRRNLGDLAFGRATSIAPVRMGKVMSRSR